MDENTIFISSHVKLPANTVSQKVYELLAVAVEVNVRTGVIMKSDLSLITTLSKDFISRVVCGYNMNDGADGLIKALDQHYHGYAKKAIQTAFSLIFKEYEGIREKSDRREGYNSPA
ncbi:MAG: DUF3870 domain-containing protein [Oscillospiraceae bacterium]|jgi:hypothetical protein|nr:DUF3870 domain-containing protein [Oscillospiraceae bacterium]